MEKLNQIREGLIKSQQAIATLKSVKEQTIAKATSVVDRLGAINRDEKIIFFQESLSRHTNIESSLRKAEAIAGHLDRINNAKDIIHKGPNANLSGFLEAMDQLEQTLQFFASTPGGGETCADVNLCLDNATTMVEDEFKKKLMALSKLVDPTSLIDESEVGAEQEVHFYTMMTLLPPLHNLARKLVLRGHKTECINIYKDARANALQQTLSHLGVEKIRSATIETSVPKWIKLMEVSVLLFSGERNLCNQVLQGIEGYVLDQCFAEVTTTSLAMLLSFRNDFQKIVKSFEKFFIILDVYKTMWNLKAEMEAIYESQTRIMLGPMFDMTQWLANEIAQTFLDFDQVVMGNTSHPMANEGVDPISICVMDFLNCSANYEDILVRLLTEHKQESQEQDLRLSGQFEQIIHCLQKKLHEKSDCWNDLGQSYLFLMNNINYIVNSVKKSKAAKEIMGEDWIKKLQGDVELYANKYKKASWIKVLDVIRSQGLVPSAEGSDNQNAAPTATKGIIKEMFQNFNKQFDEQYQKQCHWIVDDSNLRQSLSISVVKFVNSAYRPFFEQFRPIVEKSKSNCIKYKPEEIEMILLERLFAEGKTPG